jgi:hypothetical protein
MPWTDYGVDAGPFTTRKQLRLAEKRMRRDRRRMKRADRRMRRTQRRLARIHLGRFYRVRRFLQVAAGVAIVMLVGTFLLIRRKGRSADDGATLASVKETLRGLVGRRPL